MRLLLLALCAGSLAACKPSDAPAADAAAVTPVAAISGYDTYGATIADTASALPAEAIVAQAETLDGQPVKLAGTLRNVCQMAGCWATIETDGGTIRITVPRDSAGAYLWTMPKDIVGRRVVAEGTLKRSILTAEKADHLAREAGTATDSTAHRDTPELQLEATGVLVRKLG